MAWFGERRTTEDWIIGGGYPTLFDVTNLDARRAVMYCTLTTVGTLVNYDVELGEGTGAQGVLV